MTPLLSDGDLACLDCDRILPQGTPYAQRLVSMDGPDGIAEIVCVYCIVGPAAWCHDHTQDALNRYFGDRS